MQIKSVKFIKSSAEVNQCPDESFPEFAFIGRSNVGKSSLINMLTNRKSLAKTSGTPGKTQLINHFLVNKDWHLVDLPGYGYAKVSKSIRHTFNNLITAYLKSRNQLVNTFVLIDIRHTLQENDRNFLTWLGEYEIPFSIIFTKSDKLSAKQKEDSLQSFRQELLADWEELPPLFISSASNGEGRLEILTYIGHTLGLVV